MLRLKFQWFIRVIEMLESICLFSAPAASLQFISTISSQAAVAFANLFIFQALLASPKFTAYSREQLN